jgi:hypothetical protein
MQPLLPRCGRFARLASVLALLLGGSATQAERAVVYRWFDESGVAHYTTQRGRIPSAFRDAAQEVGAVVAPSPAPPAPPPPVALQPSPETPTPVALPPPIEAPAPVAAPPPSAPRLAPEDEFEEAPLGSHEAAGAASPRAATPAPDADVAAPPPPEPSPLPPADASALDERIRVLEEQVSRDQAAIQNILSEPRESGDPRVADRPDLRELAQRLPKLQADLKALREQRARPSGP